MGAVAHHLEANGIPTTGISLIRDNTERMRPPRALWVPFELGRPFGPPGDAAFQTRVLRAALALLERDDGPPILDDFPEDAPVAATADDDEGMVCPVSFPRPQAADDPALVRAVVDEIALLAPWYRLAVEQRGGRTTVGVTGVPVEEAARFLGRTLEGGAVPLKDGWSLAESIRFAAEDLGNWYLEAASARPGGAASGAALRDWLWGETGAGDLMLRVARAHAASDDPVMRRVATGALVPRAQMHRLG